jgi:hypothetical protein
LIHGTYWINGIFGGIAQGTQVCFCAPYNYHAFPQANRYTVPYVAVATGAVGDLFVALTQNKPVVFSGRAPEDLVWTELETGEACISAKGVISSDIGVLYPGRTGWSRVGSSGAENITREFLKADDYAAIVGVNTVACFDNRKLHWITQGATQGYSFEAGANERSLTKFEVPDPIYAMSYYGPRDIRWIAYTNGGALKMGKLFGDSATKLKWTWKSKLIRLPKPGRLKVAQIDSNEWGTLTNNMRYREGFYKTLFPWVTATPYVVGNFVTTGGHTYRCDIAHTSGVFATDLAALKWILTDTIYAPAGGIAGLTQAEPWCYLKVWVDADDSVNKLLVFDDFVVSDRPVRLARKRKSDCWQFEIRGNIAISSIAIAESESELNQE